MRAIADASDAFLMSDMAHISGLVAAGVADAPFEHSHVVTTTTHKSLRGPRGGMIFYRRKVKVAGQELELKDLIDSAVFPVSHWGGGGGGAEHLGGGAAASAPARVVSPAAAGGVPGLGF